MDRDQGSNSQQHAKQDRSGPEPSSVLRARLAAVAEPLGLLEGLFTHSPVPYAVFSAQGRCLLTNPAYGAMFGRAPLSGAADGEGRGHRH